MSNATINLVPEPLRVTTRTWRGKYSAAIWSEGNYGEQIYHAMGEGASPLAALDRAIAQIQRKLDRLRPSKRRR